MLSVRQSLESHDSTYTFLRQLNVFSEMDLNVHYWNKFTLLRTRIQGVLFRILLRPIRARGASFKLCRKITPLHVHYKIRSLRHKFHYLLIVCPIWSCLWYVGDVLNQMISGSVREITFENVRNGNFRLKK